MNNFVDIDGTHR